jgi:hypothetical protein
VAAEETVRIRVGIDANYANARHEDEYDTGIPRSEWNAMSEAERGAVLEEWRRDEVANQIDSWAAVIED